MRRDRTLVAQQNGISILDRSRGCLGPPPEPELSPSLTTFSEPPILRSSVGEMARPTLSKREPGSPEMISVALIWFDIILTPVSGLQIGVSEIVGSLGIGRHQGGLLQDGHRGIPVLGRHPQGGLVATCVRA